MIKERHLPRAAATNPLFRLGTRALRLLFDTLETPGLIAMVAIMYAKVYAKEGMTREQFAGYWLEKHAPLAKKMPGLRKYVIDIVQATDGEEPGYQGTAELRFNSLGDLQKAFASPEGKKAVDDVKNFARKVTSITIEENVIV